MKSMKVSFILLVFAVLFSCKKKDDPDTVPSVTTAAITEYTPSTANGGGTITSDGGSIIFASGLCYSSTSETPTVTDDTTKTSVLTGIFTSKLKNLASNTTYYVRAYATNIVGTGYGELRSFTTGNEAPVASDVTIDGEIKEDIEVTVTYTYTDKEGDEESGTNIQWYRADNAAGANTVAIDGAITNKYKISDADTNKIIWVGIRPKASTGTLEGAEVISEKKGPIGAATTVTFMYNGQEVTYGIWNSSKTGRRWLDRNLGAYNTPTAYNDYVNYGDLFQWGRPTDGHQLIIRTPNAGNPFAGTSAPKYDDFTITKASSTTPGHNKFIIPITSPVDWINPQNNNLWQGSIGINNPCPEGWHIPTSIEWSAEQLTADPVANYNQIKLTRTGYRAEDDGGVYSTSIGGFYWTSTVSGTGVLKLIQQNTSDPAIYEDGRAKGQACKCIKD